MTGSFVTCTYDIAGTDRFEILGDQGKIVVEDSKRATITRLRKPEPELSAGMDMADVMKLFTGQVDLDTLYTQESFESESPWGKQHADVLENFARNVLDGTPLIAPGADGINSVRLANAIHLSSWTGREVPIDFDEDEYLALLNQRIREEGEVPRARRVRPGPRRRPKPRAQAGGGSCHPPASARGLCGRHRFPHWDRRS